MKPPPTPLVPSGLTEQCQDVIGKSLTVRCANGWGWTHNVRGERNSFDDPALVAGHVQIIPEGFIEFTTPRGGMYGKVLVAPKGYNFNRFVAVIMSDGCNYDFNANIAPAWRVMFGDGVLDCDSEWFPILNGPDVYFGYGSIGLNEYFLDASQASRKLNG